MKILIDGDYLNGIQIGTVGTLPEFRNRGLNKFLMEYVSNKYDNLCDIFFLFANETVSLPLYYEKVSRKKRNKFALEYLDKVGLREWAYHLPGELSGGEKQRVAIARALISNPQVILADEPTGALDSITSMEVMDIFKEVNKSGKTVIIVTHEMDIANRTDRIIHLKDGAIIDRDYKLKVV